MGPAVKGNPLIDNNAEDKYGMTALNHIEEKRHIEMERLLKKSLSKWEDSSSQKIKWALARKIL